MASNERATVLKLSVYLPECGYITVAEALAAQGLHVVTDAEMAVLGAMGKLPLRCLESVRDGDSALHPMVHPPLLAELARREAKHGQ